MAEKADNKRATGTVAPTLQTSPWLILGATVILLVTVLVLTIQNTNREKRHMVQVLRAKGAALIRAVEAGSRTGMMGMMWGGAQIQQLIEETARLPDVRYLAIIKVDGTVVAHSDPERIGSPFRKGRRLVHLGPDLEENWEVVKTPAGDSAFEVHRFFNPVGEDAGSRSNPMAAMMRRHGRMHAPGDWFDPAEHHKQIIVVGLYMTPFEQAIRKEVRSSLVLSATMLLLGFAGFLSLFWMQNYRAARRSLQDTSAFANEVVAHLPVGLIATDSRGRIAFFNAAAEKITDTPRSEAIGQDPARILPQRLCGLESEIETGHTITEREMTCRFRAADPVPVSVSATRIFNEVEQLVGNVLILRDLGEVRRLEAEIRRQEKLAALGALAAGVAHEIRNPLSSIKGLATYFSGLFSKDSDDRRAARVMIEEVDRLNRVISDLLDFARPTDLKRRAVDLNPLLQHALGLIQQDAATQKITVDQHLSDDLCPADADPDRLSQCLLNLFVNAVQAMSPGGRLTVSTRREKGQQVAIVVADTGVGMTPEEMERVFNPYFTTKTDGTGLGLAIVHKIIDAHDGRIAVESAPGSGTQFKLILPCHAAGESHENGPNSGGG